MIRRFIISILAALATLSCASGRDTASRITTGEPPPYAGGVADTMPVGAIPDVLLRDNDRSKDIRLSIEYPVRPGPHPLIVFSPELGLTNRDYVGYSSYWASRGYVVIRMSHSSFGSEAAQSPADWRNRTADIKHVLDSIPQLIQRYPELDGKIDTAKVAAAGHGYGAHTALLLGGVRTFPGGVSYADPRVKAVMAISPPGPSESRGLTRESWTSLAVPTLFFTGGAEQATRNNIGTTETETPEWRREAFALAPAGDKWLIVLAGARHALFTGRFDGILEEAAKERSRVDTLYPETNQIPRNDQGMSRVEAASMRLQDLFNLTRGLGLAFWNAYLRSETDGRKALEDAGSRGGVTVEKK
jgi:predicted dienelactone hydrolase